MLPGIRITAARIKADLDHIERVVFQRDRCDAGGQGGWENPGPNLKLTQLRTVVALEMWMPDSGAVGPLAAGCAAA